MLKEKKMNLNEVCGDRKKRVGKGACVLIGNVILLIYPFFK